MVSKEEAKSFLSKIIPFAEKIPDIYGKVLELSNDENFRAELGKLGTIGSLFSIGLWIFDKTLDHLEDTEKTYYSLINRTAISVAKEIIKEHRLKSDEENNTKILKKMMEIYSFKEIDKEQYQNWNGLVPYDNPIVREFRHRIIQIIKENSL
jgi:hypothetical protein